MSRKARLKKRKEEQSQQSQSQRMYIVAGVVVVVLIFAAVAMWRLGQTPLADVNLSEIPDESVAYDSQGREHISVTDPHDPYNSNPPTSGPHADPLRTATYTRAMPDENLIHNLEHGHIWLSYRDNTDEEVIDLFTSIQREFPRAVIVTHRPDNDSRIAVAAWTRLLKLEEPDEQQILGFIKRYFDKAPESVPGF